MRRTFLLAKKGGNMISNALENLVIEKKPEMIDVRFVDINGVWQHATVPIAELESVIDEGVGFDGSSITGFQHIFDSDMLLRVDPKTAHIDPFFERPTLVFYADVFEPDTQKAYSRDPRYIAQKARDYLKSTKIADTSYWGPEAEFFLFSHLSYSNDPELSGFTIDSPEAVWNMGQNDRQNLGYKIPNKGGYYPTPPADSLQNIRTEMVSHLTNLGVRVEMHHHEVATAGQCEIDMRFDDLLSMADKLMLYKHVVRNTALAHGFTACFMPKPLFGDNGSGMHVHNSLWKNGKNLFYQSGTYGEFSELGMYYIGGILSHVDSLLAFCAPTTNSYRRLVPHYEAPVNIAFSKRNRSAIIRIPMYFSGPSHASSKRLEFRAPDPTCNPYLAFSAILMAGLDGIKRKLDPVKLGFGPLDTNIWELTGKDAKKIKSVPGSLTESVTALKADHDYLLAGGVFTEDVLDTWVELKEDEVKQLSLRPTPYEFFLYASR